MANFDARAIGERIRHARLEAGLGQEELAGLGTFSKRSLQDYEKGDTIPFKHMRELGALLKKEPVWFLYGDEVPHQTLLERMQALEAKLDAIAQMVAEGFELLSVAHRPLPGDEPERDPRPNEAR